VLIVANLIDHSDQVNPVQSVANLPAIRDETAPGAGGSPAGASQTAQGRPRLVAVASGLVARTYAEGFHIEVFGLDYETMGRALAAFGPTDLVGRSFGVLKVRIGGTEYDFSLPRRESKTAPAIADCRGAEFAADEAEASARRTSRSTPSPTIRWTDA